MPQTPTAALDTTSPDLVESMFESTPTAPPDPVFGLMDLYRQDSRPNKVNLTVGVYQNEAGLTPILDCVKQAEQLLLQREKSKSYLPIDGLARFNSSVAELIYGSQSPVIESSRLAIAQTPGGTGALRIAADLLRRAMGVESIWVCQPTWANHTQIFIASQLQIKNYQYVNQSGNGIEFEGLVAQLQNARPREAILLHTVCHNPTGFDFSDSQWDIVLQIIRERNLIPIFDFAYQGFHRNLDDDATPIRSHCAAGGEAIVCNSFSKNLGLYGERVGSISVVTAAASSIPAVQSQLKSIIRTIYSTPPQHGGAIAETVFGDPDLRAMWLKELDGMRERIAAVRTQFVAQMRKATSKRDFQFIAEQIGMFSFSGLDAQQAIRLRKEFAIYIVESGRINVAGINAGNLVQICSAIADVL